MGYWLLFGLVVALAAMSFYLGFVHAPPQPDEPGYLFWSFIRGKVQGGFVFVMVVLLPLAAFAVWRAGRVTAEVAEFITPYPFVDEVVWVPDVDGEPGELTYLVKTNDSPALVVDFYADEANRLDWNLLAESDSMLHLTRAGESLFIVVTEERTGTSVTYLLSQE